MIRSRITSWYNVNFREAGSLNYGKGLGCIFAARSCYEYMVTQKARGQSYSPYCDIPSSLSCRSVNTYGVCGIRKYAHTLSPENQYFSNPHLFNDPQVSQYGGSENYMDYCPVLTVVDSLGSLPISSICTDTQNQQKLGFGLNLYMQSFGERSVCVEHSGSMTYSLYFMNYNLGTTVAGSCHSVSFIAECSTLSFVVIHWTLLK
ncbi:unnamed protein product [Heterobilharzia americana]|nr:unnamed protein product [Heterobilharzia americana]